MKLAYFSPMPPDRTGIAIYSRELATALHRHCDVTIFTQTRDAQPIAGMELVEFASDPHTLKALDRFDHVLYHIGNNPWYHLAIRDAAALFPGVVCLHDLVNYYLVAGAGRGILLRELLVADGPRAFEHLDRIERECPERDLLRYATPSRHPSVRGLLASTPGVIVHNEASARAVRETGYAGRIDVIPLLHYGAHAAPSRLDARSVRSALGFQERDFIFGAFGFIGPTKRIDRVLHALARMHRRDPQSPARLLVVGEGESLDAPIRELGLGGVVKRTGFVPDEMFESYLDAIDSFVNLRYPSHGESSASLIQAMLGAKPCIVTDDAWFSELPLQAVLKVPFDESEVPCLAQAMEHLLQDCESHHAIGAAAREYIRSRHSPDAVALQFVRALQREPSRRCIEGVAAKPLPRADAFCAESYLATRVTELTP